MLVRGLPLCAVAVIQGLVESLMSQRLSFTTRINIHYSFTTQLVSVQFEDSGCTQGATNVYKGLV